MHAGRIAAANERVAATRPQGAARVSEPAGRSQDTCIGSARVLRRLWGLHA
jgi:hypothetical protein